MSQNARLTNSNLSNAIEQLETKRLLSVTNNFNAGTGALDISSDAADAILVTVNAGDIEVNGASISVNAADVQTLTVNGGGGDNDIDLTGVTAVDFTILTGITINGGDGADSILGSAFAEEIFGNDGLDFVNAGAGNDTVDGGLGSDSLLGGNDADSISGGVGDDSIVGQGGNDTLNGDGDNDTLNGGAGDDSIFGGSENDRILGGTGNDELEGDEDNDIIRGQGGDDTLAGDLGNDTLDSGAGHDLVFGGDDDDVIDGGTGSDTLFGDDGADTVTGGGGPDQIAGGIGHDYLRSEVEPNFQSRLLVDADSTGASDTSNAGAHNLTTGTGDGTVNLNVDGYGSFGSTTTSHASDAVYDPVGAGAAGGTIYNSSVGIRLGSETNVTFLTTGNIAGADFSLTPPTVTGNTTEGNSTFTYGDLEFELVQKVTLLTDELGNPIGSMITQTYNILNTGAAIDFEMFRYLDGDLQFDGSNIDGGGRIQTPEGEILFETDAGGTSSTSSTFVGITGFGGSVPSSGRFEFENFSGIVAALVTGGQLDDIIGNDLDSNGFIDAGQEYDVTMGLRNTYTLNAGASATYTTHTLFGTGSPASYVPPLPDKGDNIIGGDGNDTIEGSTGDDTILGDAGLDSISGSFGDDSLFGGEGQDYLDGDEGNDTLSGDEAADSLLGGEGADALNGAGGNDTLDGESGNDTLVGGSERDSMYGGLGNDRLDGQGGVDKMRGNEGDDWIRGGGSRDTLLGDEGDDDLNGEDNIDLLAGGADTDTIDDNMGADTINEAVINLS